MENAFKSVGKYWFPALCLIAGIVFLSKSGGQTTYFLLGAVGVFLVGVLSLLLILDVINRKILIALTALFVVGSGAYGYFTVDSIDTTIKDMEMKKLVKSQTIQGLKDLRTAQLAYEEVNGSFTESLDELVRFVKSGKIPTIKKIGAIPDSIGTEANARELGLIQRMPAGMSDEQAKAQGLIIRDTIMVPVLASEFNTEIELKKRKFPFDVDKMVYAPKSGEKWIVKAWKED